MSAINDGGPAFPKLATQLPNDHMDWGSDGMSLRDYCAIQVFARLASSDHAGAFHEDCAQQALQAADAYLLERSK